MPSSGLGDHVGLVQLRPATPSGSPAGSSGAGCAASSGAAARPDQPPGSGASAKPAAAGRAGAQSARSRRRQRPRAGRNAAEHRPAGGARRRGARRRRAPGAARRSPGRAPAPGSRKRTSALAGWTLTSTTSGSQLEKQRRRRMPVAGQQVGIGRPQRAEQQLVAHRPAVDEEVLRHRRAARVGRQRREARRDAARRASASMRSAFATKSGPSIARSRAPSPSKRSPGSGVEPQHLARRLGVGAVGQGEGDPGRGHRQAAHHLADRLRLRPVGAQELQPRRGGGRTGPRARPRCRAPAPPGATARHRPAAHRDAAPPPPRRPRARSGSSRPTAPSEGSASPRKPKLRMWVRSVPSIFEVACRSSASASSSAGMPWPSSCDPDQPLAAVGIGDVDPPRPGVERVLDQFLHRRGRPLDHLARGDAVGRRGVELADRPALGLHLGALGVHTPKSSMAPGAGATG